MPSKAHLCRYTYGLTELKNPNCSTTIKIRGKKSYYSPEITLLSFSVDYTGIQHLK